MTYIHTILAWPLEWAIFAFSLSFGALAEVLLLLQRRRRRRPGGLLGGLALFFLLGPLVVLALIAYFAYAIFSGMRRRR